MVPCVGHLVSVFLPTCCLLLLAVESGPHSFWIRSISTHGQEGIGCPKVRPPHGHMARCKGLFCCPVTLPWPMESKDQNMSRIMGWANDTSVQAPLKQRNESSGSLFDWANLPNGPQAFLKHLQQRTMEVFFVATNERCEIRPVRGSKWSC